MASLHAALPVLVAGRDLFAQPIDLHALAAAGTEALKGFGAVAWLTIVWWPFVVAPFVATWRVLEKSRRPGWTSLVPVYNWIQLLRVAGLPAWWLAVLCVPGVNVVAWAIACSRMSRAFGLGPGFATGLALLPAVYMVLLGVGDARYQGVDDSPDEVPAFAGIGA